LLLGFVVVFGSVARKIKVAYPIVLRKVYAMLRAAVQPADALNSSLLYGIKLSHEVAANSVGGFG
jgi:hypothetical protein